MNLFDPSSKFGGSKVGGRLVPWVGGLELGRLGWFRDGWL